MERSSFYPSIFRYPSFHIIRTTILSSIVFLACVTGIVFPFSAVEGGTDSFRSVSVSRKAPGEKAFRIAQIAQEEIVYKKAPVQVLAAAKAGEQSSEWGVAKQIGEHTWTMKVGQDQKTGSAQEILQSLNAYRQRHGVSTLFWDTGLGQFAQSRADLFSKNGSTDAHAGFTDFINNQDGFKKLGFMALGENSSFGYQVEAVHLIEWIYAGDAPHNDNQLNSQWTHVGIGVSGVATDLVFGGRKM